MAQFKYGLDQLTPNICLDLANGDLIGTLTPETLNKVEESFNSVKKLAKGDRLVYSINTGLGSLCTTRISEEEAGTLQENLLKSHSAGIGSSIPNLIAKLMLVIKLHTLCKGYSGISPSVVKRILWHIESNFTPLVPEQGSVGASGDLAPLAHLFLPIIGLGYLTLDGKKYIPSLKILEDNNLTPLKLSAKEGLALINGTQFITAFSVVIFDKFYNCLEHADLIGAMSIEAYLASPQPFNEKIIGLRPHKGAQIVAKNLRNYLKNSQIVESHKECGRVQDPYSLRCIPQVHGASRDAFNHFSEILRCELNSITDNPIIFGENEAISGGNFHGQPLALPLDYTGLAASELSNISDRRIYLLLEGKWGLPPYLITDSGLNSGFMITQYSSAALVSENKSKCFPASADSIPTSMGQEDHVSMGPISARKTLSIIENLEKVLAIELLCAAQAIDFRRPLKSSEIIETCHKHVREKISHVSTDTILANLIEKSLELITSKELIKLVEKQV